MSEDVEGISDEALFGEADRRKRAKDKAASDEYDRRHRERQKKQDEFNLAGFRVLLPDADMDRYEEFHDFFWDIISDEMN